MSIWASIKETLAFRVARKTTLTAEMQTAIHEAMAEYDRWEKVGEGREVYRSEHHDDRGRIFDDTTLVSEETKLQTKNVPVNEASQWTAVGLNVGVDPENEQTVSRLRLQQNAAVYQWINFPVTRSIIENIKRYAVGRGVKFDAFIEDIQAYLERFWRQSDMEKRVKDAFRDYLMMGEDFWVFFERPTDDWDKEKESPIIARRIPALQINDIEVDKDDMERNLAYMREYQPDPKTPEMKKVWYLDVEYPKGDEEKIGLPRPLNNTPSQNEVDAQEERVMMLKYGLSFDARGRSFLESVLRYTRIYMDFLYDRARLTHLHTKIFMIETRTTKSGKTLSTSYEKMPKGGIKLVASPDRKFELVGPQTGAGDAMVDNKMMLYNIGSGVSSPIHILNMNAENENYSSIREAANPFVQMIHDLQDEWAEYIRKMFRYVLAEGVRRGVLEPEYEISKYPDGTMGEAAGYIASRLKAGVDLKKILVEAAGMFGKPVKLKMQTVDVPIHVIFPEVAQADLEKVAQSLMLLVQSGIMSKETAMNKLGLEPTSERNRLAADDEEARIKQEEILKRMKTGQNGDINPGDDQSGDNPDNQPPKGGSPASPKA